MANINVNISEIEEAAREEIQKEITGKAKNAIVKKLRELESARNIVKNIEREIEDLRQSIVDGSFVA